MVKKIKKKIKKKNKKPLVQDLKTKTESLLIKKFPDVQKREENFDKIKKIKIRVIGIGGGGGTIVSELASQISKVDFVAANTDIQALKAIDKKVDCFQFGQNLTHGLGAGMRVDLGREAAQNEKDKIKKLCQGYDICIIIACLGGGTGSGAVPVFAKISKSLNNLTYGIFTLPFQFEGEKKMEIAKQSFKEAKNYLNAITLIPNEKVFQIINKNTPLKQALSVINKNLTKSLEGLIETIYKPGLINIDFADLKTIFHTKGKLTYLNTIEISKKESSIKELITQLLNSSFYPYTIQGTKGILFNITGEKNLSLSEVNQISRSISEAVSPEAKIVFGISFDKRLEPIVKTTLLAVGCEGINREEKFVKQKKFNPPQKKLKLNKTLKKETLINKSLVEKTEKPFVQTVIQKRNEEDRTRKNGLQIKKEVQELEKEVEKEILNKEKFWETPAFLRRKS
jgi:cell division protein FtsZ